jgi:hypothetical protein
MKTKSLFIAAFVMISAVVSAVGKDEPTSKAGLVVVPVKGSEVFKIIYKGETAGRVKLNLYNASNQVVFSEIMTNVEGFIRPLNFKGLAFGEYTLELIDATGKRTEKIAYTASRAVIRVARLGNEGKFLLAIANSSATKLNVKIFNAQNDLIHTETRELKGDYAQVYKVTNTEEVTFEVSDNAGNTQVVRYY